MSIYTRLLHSSNDLKIYFIFELIDFLTVLFNVSYDKQSLRPLSLTTIYIY